MPEANRDTTLLIATSWQALHRANLKNSETLICDCTVMLLFAGFYIEANLNYIIDKMGEKRNMEAFLNVTKKSHPGMQQKLAWFYNKFVARSPVTNRQAFSSSGIYMKLRRKYPGFAKIYRFRNDISHGAINPIAESRDEALKLRQQAKDIVDDLFKTAKRWGCDIPRDNTYWQAVGNSNFPTDHYMNRTSPYPSPSS